MAEQDRELQEVMDTLSALAPTAEDAPRTAPQAMARLRQAIDPYQEPRFPRILTVFKWKPALSSLLVILLLILALSFPGVRALANDFLGLFRVQKFSPISISPEQLILLEEIAESGLFPGRIDLFEPPGEPREVPSLIEAAVTYGREPRKPNKLGEADRIFLIEGGRGRLIIDVEGARAIVQAAGADPELIPSTIDGSSVEVTIFPGISQSWEEGFTLLQSLSPLVDYPEDLNTISIGEALLQALGMDQEDAYRLARSIDWTTTLLVPIPENIASFSEVNVDTVTGLLLVSSDKQHAAILWQRDGIVYALSGGEVEELVEIADSMH